MSSFWSTVFGFLSLRVRELAIGYDFAKFVSNANFPPDQLKARFLDDLLRSVQLNRTVLEEKILCTKVATWFALAGLFCYTIVVVKLTYSFVNGS